MSPTTQGKLAGLLIGTFLMISITFTVAILSPVHAQENNEPETPWSVFTQEQAIMLRHVDVDQHVLFADWIAGMDSITKGQNTKTGIQAVKFFYKKVLSVEIEKVKLFEEAKVFADTATDEAEFRQLVRDYLDAQEPLPVSDGEV